MAMTSGAEAGRRLGFKPRTRVKYCRMCGCETRHDDAGRCGVCWGALPRPDLPDERCTTCWGKGYVIEYKPAPFGPDHECKPTCRMCGGSGRR